MMPSTGISYEHLLLRVDGVNLDLATVARDGARPPIVFLHGFGSTKEDYVDVIERARRSPSRSSALYAAALRHKVRPGAVLGIFESMVELSTTAT